MAVIDPVPIEAPPATTSRRADQPDLLNPRRVRSAGGTAAPMVSPSSLDEIEISHLDPGAGGWRCCSPFASDARDRSWCRGTSPFAKYGVERPAHLLLDGLLE